MKVDLNEDAMTAIKDAMEVLQIADTHDNRLKFANQCVQIGAAQSVLASLYTNTLKQEFPKRFEGYASAKPEEPIVKQGLPSVCSECNMPILLGPNGKWCCNCQVWAD